MRPYQALPCEALPYEALPYDALPYEAIFFSSLVSLNMHRRGLLMRSPSGTKIRSRFPRQFVASSDFFRDDEGFSSENFDWDIRHLTWREPDPEPVPPPAAEDVAEEEAEYFSDSDDRPPPKEELPRPPSMWRAWETYMAQKKVTHFFCTYLRQAST